MTIPKNEIENTRQIDFTKRAESFYHSFFNSNLFATASFNRHFNLSEVNQAFGQILGYEQPLDYHELIASLEKVELLTSEFLRRDLVDGKVLQQEFTFRHKQGYNIFMRVTFIPVFINETFEGVISIGIDISQKKRDETIHKQLAFYDDLTGLPNRRHFFSKLSKFLQDDKERLSSLHVMIISLDNLKKLNEVGFHIGDAALKLIARILIKTYGDNSFAARINGSEFAILVDNKPHVQVEQELARILFTVNQLPHQLFGKETTLKCSAGISTWPEHGNTFEALVQSAERARCTAINNRMEYCTYTSDMNSINQLNLDRKIKKAIEENQFYLVYQPIVDLASRTHLGYEALIRWQHPDEGMIVPNQFIPYAEQSGIIIDIERRVLLLACKRLKQLEQTHPNTYLSVNISALHFQQNIVDHISEAVKITGANPKLLRLEITETGSMKDPSNTIQKLNQLKLLGIKVSIDDFGTGYSSLQYLGNFPVDEIKLDQTFINPMTAQKRTIINAVIGIARDYQIDVVAEGIETEEQLGCLIELGCKYGQGYLIGKPMKM